MIIFLLSLALWFLCGIQAFVLLVREKVNETHDDYNGGRQPNIRLASGDWEIWWDRSWSPLSLVFMVHTVGGLVSLGFQTFPDEPPHWLLNFGFRFVAKEVIPLEIARKLEDKKPQPQPQTAQTTASQQLALGLGASMLQGAGLTAAAQQQLLGQLGQPPQQP